MFILKLKYSKPVDEVDKVLASHTKYLEKYCSLKKFICTGRLNPRTGGVIICNAKNKEEVETLIKEDPFYTNEVAEYEIIEFLPKVYAEGFEEYIK
jgi:uncharacterized protein YciI